MSVIYFEDHGSLLQMRYFIFILNAVIIQQCAQLSLESPLKVCSL